MHWLLLKEIVHNVTYPYPKGTMVEETWQDTCIIWQQGVWVHYADMKFFMSIKIYSPHDLYDGGVRGEQELLLLWLLLRESMGKIFPILIMIFPGGYTSTSHEVYNRDLV